MIERPKPFDTNLETYRWLTTIAGRCWCSADQCESSCLFCMTMESFWPCPHDAVEGWPRDVVAGT